MTVKPSGPNAAIASFSYILYYARLSSPFFKNPSADFLFLIYVKSSKLYSSSDYFSCSVSLMQNTWIVPLLEEVTKNLPAWSKFREFIMA